MYHKIDYARLIQPSPLKTYSFRQAKKPQQSAGFTTLNVSKAIDGGIQETSETTRVTEIG